ncbi:Seven transmembrane domain-containing tyrosine-protein kinase 1 [Hibiscus syriacus]|uniref:Seven transmembrane domain-containing tyrosine-protein kinase 1 n=1 Tax=Hibiscus syriacus TaxID=106335 RepID=A0A6A2ZHF6_HIBSY|nr:Seven transmembrane domain-containing tyrosine-protein kinase 1 [Hibiscus syriacus]
MTPNNKHKSLEIGIDNRQAELELDFEEDLEELESELESDVNKMVEKILEYRPTIPYQLKATLPLVLSSQRPNFPDVRSELGSSGELNPGYEASQVNYKGEKPMGFALFSNARFAVAAKDALQFFEMPRHEAVQALDVYKRAGQQVKI